jgi:hypothetical protein
MERSSLFASETGCRVPLPPESFRVPATPSPQSGKKISAGWLAVAIRRLLRRATDRRVIEGQAKNVWRDPGVGSSRAARFGADRTVRRGGVREPDPTDDYRTPKRKVTHRSDKKWHTGDKGVAAQIFGITQGYAAENCVRKTGRSSPKTDRPPRIERSVGQADCSTGSEHVCFGAAGGFGSLCIGRMDISECRRKRFVA